MDKYVEVLSVTIAITCGRKGRRDKTRNLAPIADRQVHGRVRRPFEKLCLPFRRPQQHLGIMILARYHASHEEPWSALA
jgi:hypothetical protein